MALEAKTKVKLVKPKPLFWQDVEAIKNMISSSFIVFKKPKPCQKALTLL